MIHRVQSALLSSAVALAVSAPCYGQHTLAQLQQRLADAKADRALLRKDVLEFLRSHPGTPAALDVARILQRLPSPLDLLDARRLPADDVPGERPAGQVAVCRGHTRAAASVAFSADGGVLASAGWDNKLRLWKLAGPAAVEWAVLEGSPSGIAFAPDGKTLAAGGAGTSVVLWDVCAAAPKKKKRLPGHEHRPFAVAFSPTGKMLASGCSEPEVRLWKLEDGDVEAWAVLEEERVTLGVSSLAFSADGKKLVAGSFAGQKALRLWDVAGTYMKELELPAAPARLVAFSPDDKTLAFAGEKGAVHLWDMDRATAVKKRVLTGHPGVAFPGGVNALAFSPDGSLLASSGQDRKLLLWETSTGRSKQEWQFPVEVKAVSFACDGRHLGVGQGNGLVLILRLSQR